jgi:phospholipid:diacylglycerol acyltransferase
LRQPITTLLRIIGYDNGTIDWRLPYHLSEELDGYFTKLQYKTKAMKRTTGKKVILASHSMGALVVHRFFTRVCQQQGDSDHHTHH